MKPSRVHQTNGDTKVGGAVSSFPAASPGPRFTIRTDDKVPPTEVWLVDLKTGEWIKMKNCGL